MFIILKIEHMYVKFEFGLKYEKYGIKSFDCEILIDCSVL